MSYCRKGLDGSSVYVFPTGGPIVCHECPLTGANHEEPTPAAMLEHLELHRECGHTVPQTAIDRLIREASSGS